MKNKRNITIKVIHNNKENARMLAKYFARKYEDEIKIVKKRIAN